MRKPNFTAFSGVRPSFSSSRKRSKMTTLASTAMPMPSRIPAMPCSVSCAPEMARA